MEEKEIIMGLDISTTCIGICLLEYDKSSMYGKILELTHVSPKVPKGVKGIETLFLKKKIFENEFLNNWKNSGISRVIIESPLLRSNNVNTVGVLLQFNGMVSDCVYNVLGVVPEYISSYEARQFSFPDLMAIRKFNKNGEPYDKTKIINAIEGNKFVLFGNYVWDIDKKMVIQSKVSEIFPDINWLLNKKGELKKENYDACDAYVACIGFLNKERFGNIDMKASNIEIKENSVSFDVSYWNTTAKKIIYFSDLIKNSNLD